jgi:beta-galactosidase/beta-glucuronidase
VLAAADRLGLMLWEEADDAQARLLQAGLAAGVPAPKGNLPPQTTTPQCHKGR